MTLSNHLDTEPADTDAGADAADTDAAATDAAVTDAALGGFGNWYRGRPFVGGVITMVAGIAMFFSGQLDLGNIRVHVGVEGMQATILPIVLALVGVLAVLMPAHRIFYGVIALVCAVYSLVAVNLGGFFIGFVLGCVGGVMIVSWMPRRPRGREVAVDPLVDGPASDGPQE
jgi:hypothetical protein